MSGVMIPVFRKTPERAQAEGDSFVIFMRFPQEIRNMIWIEASADSKPNVCTHLLTKSPRNGLPGFPRNQPTVDTNLSLMHTCRDSREALTSKAGGVRFRYSLVAEMNVPCRAFDPSRDTLYLGDYNWAEATERLRDMSDLPDPGPYGAYPVTTPVDNELRETLRQVETIALEPGVWSKSRNSQGAIQRFYSSFSRIFPKARNLSMVVSPSVPLVDADVWEAIAGTPIHRCRLVEADGDHESVEVQSLELVHAVRMLLNIMQSPDRDLPVKIHTFEVYRQRQGQMQWEKYPM